MKKQDDGSSPLSRNNHNKFYKATSFLHLMTDLRYQKGYNAVVQSVALFRGAVALSEGVRIEQVIPTCGATGALDAIFRATALEHFKAGKKPTAVLGYPEYFDAQRQLTSSEYLMHLVDGPTAGPYKIKVVLR